jgi:glycosyltransferase involved in cell wall biosynthesis
MKNDMLEAVLRPNPAWQGVRCRLLYIVGQLRLGGLERQLYYLLAKLDHAQHQPAVVVWNFDPSDKYYRDIEALKVPIYGFAAEWSPLSKLRALRALARIVAPEVIHSYAFYTNFAAHYAARGTSALAFGSLRSDFAFAKSDSGLIRGALNARWPSCLIANSAAAADTARRHSGPFAPRQVFVVRNALDLNQFSCFNGIPGPRTHVAAVGSLFPVKRWDRLLKAIQKVGVGAGDIRFRIAGEGPLRPVLEKLAAELGISRAVDFQGAIQDMPAFLRGAKFLVHTSESEGCPNAVMEAMACGLPVVAMEAGDIPDLVEEGKTGFVVRQGDETTFLERVCQLLSNDELCFRMGLAARAKAEREFRLERLVSETLAVYKAAGWKVQGTSWSGQDASV